MLPSILDTCTLRAEILSGELSLDLFAAKLKLVVDGKAPPVYQDPEIFFANTFPTAGLKTLIAEVFGRLTGTTVGSPLIRLETSFGGGKTHDEIALWHIARQGRQIPGLDRFTDRLEQIPSSPVQIAAIACQDLDPTNGDLHADGISTHTLWGEIAYQIGGIDGYQLLRGSDEQKVSPGTGVLQRLIGDRPTLIVLDEIAQYLRKAKAVKVGNSDLAGQVVAFLFALMDLAGSCQNLVFVYSLAASSDSFADETAELQETIKASARQEKILTPSTDVEIYNIVKQRLFMTVDDKAAKQAAQEYLQAYRSSRANLPEGCKDAAYVQTIEASYPIHPELFTLLTKKIASIPNFNRTRGALRLFAIATRYLWREGVALPMIHPHHLPVGIDDEITNELTSRLQRPLMRMPIQADLYNSSGREAHAQLQDREWLAAGKSPFSTWVGRTIFLHSINQGIVAGIRKSELNLSLLIPGNDSNFVDRALDRLTEVAWYLDFDPVLTIARFKEEPSINKIVAEEKEQVGRGEAKEDLRQRRDSIFATRHFKLVSAPTSPGDVDDGADEIALCIIDFQEEMVTASTDPAPAIVEQIFQQTGESGKFRIFRNRLLFLVANKAELDRAIELARELRAIKNILKSEHRLSDLSENQCKQLKGKEGELDLGVRIALTNAYRHLFYPAQDAVKAPKGLMHYTLPVQDTSDIKGKNNQQEVILKTLKDCQKIRADDSSNYAPAYILQKVWSAGLESITTKGLKESFAKDLGLNFFVPAEIAKLKETILTGLEIGQWDLKVADRSYINTPEAKVVMPDQIEFSDRQVLYRRGILQPPAPREIELSAQTLPGEPDSQRVPVRVKWRTNGAIGIQLWQDSVLIPNQFRPADEYTGEITRTSLFKLVVDYGDGEVLSKEAKAVLWTPSSDTMSDPLVGTQIGVYAVKNNPVELPVGSLNSIFNEWRDRVHDQKIQSVKSLELTVSEIVDYRKLTTALPLLMRLPIEIDQLVTIQSSNNRFMRLEYQGDIKGFQTLSNSVNTFLTDPDMRAEVSLKVRVNFATPVLPAGTEMQSIEQTLGRNPIERGHLAVTVVYE